MVSPVIPEVSTSAESSMMVLSITSYAGTATSYDLPAPQPRSILHGGQPPMLPMLIPLPRFANKNFVRLLSGLRWSQLSHIHHPQSHTLPRPVLICTLLLPSVPGRVTVIFRFVGRD